MMARRDRTRRKTRMCQGKAAHANKAAALIAARKMREAEIQSGRAFIPHGMQIASGVPLQCGERADFQTFRLGLFGLDKLQNIERTVQSFAEALSKIER